MLIWVSSRFFLGALPPKYSKNALKRVNMDWKANNRGPKHPEMRKKACLRPLLAKNEQIKQILLTNVPKNVSFFLRFCANLKKSLEGEGGPASGGGGSWKSAKGGIPPNPPVPRYRHHIEWFESFPKESRKTGFFWTPRPSCWANLCVWSFWMVCIQCSCPACRFTGLYFPEAVSAKFSCFTLSKYQCTKFRCFPIPLKFSFLLSHTKSYLSHGIESKNFMRAYHQWFLLYYSMW